MPLKFPENESVDFLAVNNTSGRILTSDLQHAEEFLNQETFYGLIVLYLNIGYNFKNWGKIGKYEKSFYPISEIYFNRFQGGTG